MTTEQVKEFETALGDAERAFAAGPRLRSVDGPPTPRKPRMRIPSEREMYETSVSAMKSIARDR